MGHLQFAPEVRARQARGAQAHQLFVQTFDGGVRRITAGPYVACIPQTGELRNSGGKYRLAALNPN